jgi:hypothetical protein
MQTGNLPWLFPLWSYSKVSSCCHSKHTFPLHLNILYREKFMFFCRQGELKLNRKLYVEETLRVEGFPEALADLKQKLAEMQVDPLKKFPQVLFLGTGSCIPNKTRNTSSILIHTRYDRHIILLRCIP